jgi:hypothetical protein
MRNVAEYVLYLYIVNLFLKNTPKAQKLSLKNGQKPLLLNYQLVSFVFYI